MGNIGSDSLVNLEILVLDIQATGADPEKNHLLEIGWAKTSALETNRSKPLKINTFLLPLPENETIPRRITRITGIGDSDLADAHDSAVVWKKLVRTAHGVRKAGNREKCPVVIHFSRFEERWLTSLRYRCSRNGFDPFDIVCTHEIAKRLLPDLPRRGLRAIAGYFGHSVDELRRASHHVAATAFVWKKLVESLGESHGVHTLGELHTWMASTNSPARCGRSYPMDRALRLSLPDKPGIYRMLRSNGDVMYVGKATSLKTRVNSYFRKRTQHADHILEMLAQATGLDITVAGSAFEAAILENDWIKRLSPPYNVALRERDRSLWYCTTDYSQFSEVPDDHYRVGPLPSRESVQPLSVIARLIRHIGDLKDAGDDTLSLALGLPAEFAPEADCFSDGFGHFFGRHGDLCTTSTIERALVKLGADLWRERLEEKECENDETDDACELTEPETPVEFTWTPETVADSLERALRHAALTVRKSRWYGILCNTTVSWESKHGKGHDINSLTFESGTLRKSERFSSFGDIDLPSGKSAGSQERKMCFDIAAYDRMRVATTELRRITGENRSVKLYTDRATVLNGNQLSRLLKWI